MPTTSIAIAEALYLIFVAAASLTVEIQRKKPFVSLFGHGISRPFQQLLFSVTLTLTFRSLFLPDQRFATTACTGECKETATLYYVWVAIESVIISFLMLCMPYLLQKQLATVINIQPGESLQMWIFLVLGMDVFAIVLSSQVSPNFWALKRFGDALLVIPRINTLQLYVKMTTTDSQPSLLIGTLTRLEYCLFVAVTGASLLYAFEDHQNPNNWFVAIKMASIFLTYTVLFVHGVLLTCLDNAYRYVYPDAPSTGGSDGGNSSRSPASSQSAIVSRAASRNSNVNTGGDSVLAVSLIEP
eukprot:Nitzschia sp. Nitz4//scaffold300_size22576//2934//3833//NITZ4_008542-RA/size22576-processed-gene-0.20-mRNA-1//1//CDS//3329546979//6424//frame0